MPGTLSPASSSPSLALHPYAQSLVRIKARQIIFRAGHNFSDLGDIQQELTLYLLEVGERYDAALSSQPTFISNMLDRRIAMLLRHRRRICRATNQRMRSIDINARDEDGSLTSLANTLPETTREAVTGNTASLSNDDQEAVRSAYQSMPPELKEVAELLMHDSPADVAKAKGFTRRRMASVMEAIREHLENAGF